MSKTRINTNIEQAVIGYMLNSAFSTANQKLIGQLQARLGNELEDCLWLTPPEALHITLLDWIDPLMSSVIDKDELFEQILASYDRVVAAAIAAEEPITVRFDKVRVAPAAVFLVGTDKGQYARIRQKFLDNVTPIPGNKLPPQIVHSTLGRFTKEVELEPLERFIGSLDIDFSQIVTEFRLIRETLDPLLEFAVVKTYKTHRP